MARRNVDTLPSVPALVLLRRAGVEPDPRLWSDSLPPAMLEERPLDRDTARREL